MDQRLILLRSLSTKMGNLADITDLRKRYIDALHAADSGNYSELIQFVTK